MYLGNRLLFSNLKKKIPLPRSTKCAGIVYMDSPKKEKQVKIVSVQAKSEAKILALDTNLKAPDSTKQHLCDERKTEPFL